MALTMGNDAPATAAREQKAPPYWERLEPLDGGYTLSDTDGRKIGQLRVFDDREAGECIHAQFTNGFRGKVTTLKFSGLESFDDLIDALTRSRDAMHAARRSKRH